MASRRASAAPLLPPPRQNFHFCFPRPPGASHLSSVTSRRGVRPVSSTSMPSYLLLAVHRAQFAGTRATCCVAGRRSLQQNAAGRNSRYTPSPAPEIVAAQLNKALCLPPTSCPGWIAPCLHSLTVAERCGWSGHQEGGARGSCQAATSGGNSRVGGVHYDARGRSRVLPGGELAARLRRARGRTEQGFEGEDAFEGCGASSFAGARTVSPEREYTVPAGGVFEPSPSFEPSDRALAP